MKWGLAVLALALVTSPSRAEETSQTGPQIQTLLPTIIAVGTVKETRQKFWDDGYTEYQDRGHYSFGRWWVDGDKYCSKWPPSEAVSCYGVVREGDKLIWVPRAGDPIINRIEVR